MTNAYLLESLAWCLPMAVLIFVVLKWASGQKKLQQEINPVFDIAFSRPIDEGEGLHVTQFQGNHP